MRQAGIEPSREWFTSDALDLSATELDMYLKRSFSI